MLQNLLTKEEFEIIRICLVELSGGSYIDDEESITVAGFDKGAIKQILQQWPNVVFGEYDKSIIFQCFNQLTGFPHEMETQLTNSTNCKTDELVILMDKIRNLPVTKTPYVLE